VAGAFSTGAPGTHPFIMMSYHDDLFSLSTLAHELGPFPAQPSYLREPASRLLQLLDVCSRGRVEFPSGHGAGASVQANPDPQFQLTLLEEAFDNFHRYFLHHAHAGAL